MSIGHTFSEDLPISGLEIFNPVINRTVASELTLPHDKDTIYPQYDFNTSHNFNTIIDKLQDNLQYLYGFSTQYTSILPLDQVTCSEFDQEGKIGLFKNNNYEVTFTNKEIKIYQSGVLYQTLTETSFGVFRNIRDVVIVNNDILIIDGNHILKIDISTTPATFITFFGGYGGSDTEYKFQTPSKLVFDESASKLYVWDKGNAKIKIYDSEFSFIESVTTQATGFDVVGGVIYVSDSTYITNLTSLNKFKHNLETITIFVTDQTQKGFVWIGNNKELIKYTIEGLELGRYDVTNLQDLQRRGTKLYVIDNGVWKTYLDFSKTTSISTLSAFGNTRDSIYIHPDELNSDIVINDSLFKVFENIDEFNLALTGRYIVNLDSASNLAGIETTGVSAFGCDIDCNFFQGYDEVASCNSLERPIDELYELFLKTGSKLLGSDNISLSSSTGQANDLGSFPIDWSLGSQSCEGVEPQLFNANFTPLSFMELQNPALECNALTSAGCNSVVVNPDTNSLKQGGVPTLSQPAVGSDALLVISNYGTNVTPQGTWSNNAGNVVFINTLLGVTNRVEITTNYPSGSNKPPYIPETLTYYGEQFDGIYRTEFVIQNPVIGDKLALVIPDIDTDERYIVEVYDQFNQPISPSTFTITDFDPFGALPDYGITYDGNKMIITPTTNSSVLNPITQIIFTGGSYICRLVISNDDANYSDNTLFQLARLV